MKALNLPLPDVGASTNVKATSLSLKEFVTHLVPKSAVEAMANNEILQIVAFAIFFGVALAAIGEKGQTLIKSVEQVADVMLRITGYVMKFAPIAVFAAIAATITNGNRGARHLRQVHAGVLFQSRHALAPSGARRVRPSGRGHAAPAEHH